MDGFGNLNANLRTDFDLICELSIQGRYDYVIVGSGLGGGILARKLVEGKKRVLLIEKGGVTFSTHCLNSARPHWQIGSVQGPSQDNDIVYNAVKEKVQTAAGSDPYVGGPVYCLGGRTTVWGLFAPEINEKTYQQYFPERISKYLGDKGYANAFNLLTNGSQTYNNPYPTAADISSTEVNLFKDWLKKAIKAFYNDYKIVSEPIITLAPVAAEFKSSDPYIFPQGAYSTVDAILDKIYARDQYLTVLLNAEVLRVSTNKSEDAPSQIDAVTSKTKVATSKAQVAPSKTQVTPSKMTVTSKIGATPSKTGPATPKSTSTVSKSEAATSKAGATTSKADAATSKPLSLTVRTGSSKRLGQIYANDGIILCAGTIGTAVISLNSGLQDSHSLVGKGLTDHEIWGVRFAKEKSKILKDPVKLQSEITVCGTRVLLNVVINANTFFGRDSTVFAMPTQYMDQRGRLLKVIEPSEQDPANYDTVNVTLEYAAELYDKSEVLDIPAPDPVIRARRPALRQDEKCQKEMQDLATQIRNYLLNITGTEANEKAPRFSLAGFGVVAHEVGTMRLQDPKKTKDYVVNDMYQVRDFPDLYVCDLSIFPVSPPANPSLTLAALALQLADDLLEDGPESSASCDDSDY